jgi:cytochrome c
MDSFELNKIAGAVLGSLLFIMGLGVISDALFAAPHMAKPGYPLPAAEEQHGGAAAAAAPEVVVPLPVLLAKADPKKGENLVKACAACHSLDSSGAAKATGPSLYGVIDRAVGSTGFAYSDTMKAKGGKWDYAQINAFIANPKGVVAGTKMSYAGEKDAAKRADIIAYLRSLASSPAPLPAP